MHRYDIFVIILVSDMYLIWIQIGYWYNRTRRVSSEKKRIYFLKFWYGSNTREIHLRYSEYSSDTKKRKKTNKRRIWHLEDFQQLIGPDGLKVLIFSHMISLSILLSHSCSLLWFSELAPSLVAEPDHNSFFLAFVGCQRQSSPPPPSCR